METKMKSKTFSFSFLILLIILAFTKLNAQSNSGTEFWVTFYKNFNNTDLELSLFITSDVNTSGTVSIPGQGFSTAFNVTANEVTTVILPVIDAVVNTIDGIENRGILVTSIDPVTLYGLNRIFFTTDAFLGLPKNVLGNEYVVLAYRNGFASDVATTAFSVVGTENGTNLEIIPSVTTGSRSAGVPYSIQLNQGEVYQLRNLQSTTADLTGTIITSDKPVAVFGGHTCAYIPFDKPACDLLVEQLPPTSTWGKSFISVPLKTRLIGDTFRFLAKDNNTTVFVNGTDIVTLNRGQFYETIISGSAFINSTEPILVAQYSNSSSFDGIVADPFMMLIPPFEQFLGGYTFTTPASGFINNFVNIVAPNSAVGLIELNGVAISAAEFSQIGSSGFSGAQVDLTLGSHNVQGPLPFGAFIYGFDDFDSYGYPGGQSFSPIATVTSVELAPKTAARNVGQQHCVVATVKDQFGDPVVGVRVDFEVTGANSTAGFANTLADGTAEFCYTGTSAGTDNIVASVGTLSDDASVEWIQVVVEACPFSQGYWKNHPEEWPESALPMTLGTVNSYNKTELLKLFNTSVSRDASLILGYQLIAAKLNVANGSPLPSEVQDAIEDADDAIGTYSLPAGIRPNTALGQTMTTIAKILDMYNNKLLTPECLYEPEMTENKLNQAVEEGLVLGNYPNPFNPITQIRFSIPENNFVSLKVYNSVGQLVRTLVNENLNKGFHNYEWNATDDNGNKLSSGIYLYRLQAGELVQTHKMILMK